MAIHHANKSPYTKHVGRWGDRRCVIVLQLPEEKHLVHIIDTEMLPDAIHQNVMEVLSSPEGQSSEWLATVLGARMLYDGTKMLQTLYERNYVQQVPVEQVSLTPSPNQLVPFTQIYGTPVDPLASQQNPSSDRDQLFDNIVAQEQAKLNTFDSTSLNESINVNPISDPTVSPTQMPQVHNQHTQNLSGDVNSEQRQLALNLVEQAKLMQADAKNYLRQAAQYDASVVDLGTLEEKQQEPTAPVLSENEVVITIDTERPYVDGLTGKNYKSSKDLKSAITRRENAANG